jgi:hypothetical protein
MLLSVDAEGSIESILLGANELLFKSRYVCVEHHGRRMRRQQFVEILGSAFKLVHENALNLIFQRQETMLLNERSEG